MKKIALVIILAFSLNITIYSQEDSMKNKEILEVTFGKGFSFDTVSLSTNRYLLVDRDVVKSNRTDGLTGLHLTFFLENNSVKAFDLDGNIYKVPKIESIFSLNVCVNQLVKNSNINLKDGKYLIINYKGSGIHYNQYRTRPRFF